MQTDKDDTIYVDDNTRVHQVKGDGIAVVGLDLNRQSKYSIATNTLHCIGIVWDRETAILVARAILRAAGSEQ